MSDENKIGQTTLNQFHGQTTLNQFQPPSYADLKGHPANSNTDIIQTEKSLLLNSYPQRIVHINRKYTAPKQHTHTVHKPTPRNTRNFIKTQLFSIPNPSSTKPPNRILPPPFQKEKRK